MDSTTRSAPRTRLAHPAFAAVWALATLGLGWLLLRGPLAFDQPATVPCLLAGLVCTVALLWWLPGAPAEPTARRTRRGWLALAAIGVAAALLLATSLLSWRLLLGLPLVAAAVLAGLRVPLSRREVAYALGLALVAAVAGLGAPGEPVSPLAWAAMQVPLVTLGLLAGWAILKRTGLWQAGTGSSLFLAKGLRPALRGFALGMLIAVPWALLNVVLGSANQDRSVVAWLQPLAALQPGIAEEAWARVFLVSLAFLALRPLARTRTAMAAAIVVVGYWFAYLHTSRVGGVGSVVSAVMIGTLYSLPLSYLWLRRGLETAIGFHFLVDFVRFAAALLLNTGLWRA